jgi:uncharacterized membrane protein YhaH (DUF805 family)
MPLIDTLTRIEGRISRKPFWIGIVIVTAIFVAVVVGILALVGEDALDGPYSGDSGLMLILNVLLLLTTVPVTLKRLHDLNHSFGPLVPAFIFEALALIGSVTSLTGSYDINTLGWTLMTAYGVYGLALLIFLGFYRGTRGPNDFGPDPLAPEEIPARVDL